MGMKKDSSIFLWFCLSLAVVYSLFWSEARDLWRPEVLQSRQNQSLRVELQREQLRTQLAMHQLWDLRAETVSFLSTKPAESGDDRYRQQQILSSLGGVSRAPASELSPLENSRSMFERGRTLFVKRDYSQAALVLRELLGKYPGSVHVTEAHFLLAESYYLEGAHAQALGVMERMIANYPDNLLTGFILIRLGMILESRQQPSEAREVYQMVSAGFPQEADLVKQADKLTRALEGKM